ncbi:hypothetical protein FISHEDRAFT_53502 [Fistulina hepatica ATCC 64428]|nr:hypothetical protein FISHEDRAFT_53502 [Fistulina hepatica ATCC 64428]
MSTVYRVGPSWLGFAHVRKLFIFGDSYSSVRLSVDLESPLYPSPARPLGIPFPGVTSNQPAKPNWVGHLITKYAPGHCFKPAQEKQDEAYIAAPLLVYDYAYGGAIVPGLVKQVDRVVDVTAEYRDSNPWTADDSLFITWVGINDCAYSRDHSRNMKLLFELQDKLYAAGARNFVFFDLPPLDRTPVAMMSEIFTSSHESWNAQLNSSIKQFSSTHDDATVLLFSANRTFTAILDHPEVYGFHYDEDGHELLGVWYDRLHPSSEVHDFVANDLSDFLGGVEPYQKGA